MNCPGNTANVFTHLVPHAGGPAVEGSYRVFFYIDFAHFVTATEDLIPAEVIDNLSTISANSIDDAVYEFIRNWRV